MKNTTILWVVVLALGYLSLLLLSTVRQYVAFAIIFAVLFSGLYNKIEKSTNRTLAATTVTLLILFLLVVPTLYVVSVTIQQAPIAYTSAIHSLEKESVKELLGNSADEVRNFLDVATEKLRQNVLNNASVYLAHLSNAMLGLFVMFVTVFFFLRDGQTMFSFAVKYLPVSNKQAKRFLNEMEGIIHGVIRGQLVTAIVQGGLTAFVLWLVGVPSPVFWGVITAILSIIPILGPFLVYIPASLYLFINEKYFAGVFLLIVGIGIISQIDNILRPYIAAQVSKVHPLTIVLGVICGLKLWGLVGFIIGPIVLAAFLGLFAFLGREYSTE